MAPEGVDEAETAAAAARRTLERQLFELSAVEYRATPCDQTLLAMLERRPKPDDHASASEVAYEVVYASNFSIPSVANLAKALAEEHRVQEASYFARRWLELDGASTEAHRLMVLLSCLRMDVKNARASFKALQSAKVQEGMLWALETVMLLAFSDGAHAPETAQRALACTPVDPLAAPLAEDAAYRRDNARLLVAAFAAEPGLANNPGREPLAKQMLRGLLLEVLRGAAP